METPDYAERPAPGLDATLCTRCGHIKPNAQFKRIYTPLQARARGYKNDFDVEYLSSVCHACRPVKKLHLAKMSKRELKNAQGVGKLRALDVDFELAKRKQRYARKAAEKTSRRWDRAKRTLWQDITKPLSQEIVACKQQAGHIAKRWPDLNDRDFFAIYLEYLLHLRGQLRTHRLRRDTPEHTRWQDYITFEELTDFMDKWRWVVEQLPVAYVRRMRTPGFSEVTDTRDTQAAPKPSLQRADSLDRLAQIKGKK